MSNAGRYLATWSKRGLKLIVIDHGARSPRRRRCCIWRSRPGEDPTLLRDRPVIIAEALYDPAFVKAHATDGLEAIRTAGRVLHA